MPLTCDRRRRRQQDQKLVEHRLINMAQGKGDRKLKAFAKKKQDVPVYAKKTTVASSAPGVPSDLLRSESQ